MYSISYIYIFYIIYSLLYIYSLIYICIKHRHIWLNCFCKYVCKKTRTHIYIYIHINIFREIDVENPWISHEISVFSRLSSWRDREPLTWRTVWWRLGDWRWSPGEHFEAGISMGFMTICGCSFPNAGFHRFIVFFRQIWIWHCGMKPANAYDLNGGQTHTGWGSRQIRSDPET